MIQGSFGARGELFFEIDLIAADSSLITVNVLDTGFTDWLAINIQDAESLGWSFIEQREMQTARGEVIFNRYEGTVMFDSQEVIIPILGCEEISEILLGLPWLERRLVVDRKADLLTLGVA